MDPVHARIAAFLRRSGVGRADPLLVAISGGADSTALLRASCALGLRVSAAHVHHGLRGADADADAGFVAELAASLGVAFRCARVDAARRDGRSPEARARSLRYAALEALRVAAGCRWILTAHTLDDQAETVLLRALRGTTPLGLAGIQPLDIRRRLLRPVLELRRHTLREYLQARAQPWREDASNADSQLPRSRLRAEVLPLLERVQPGAARKLAQLADAARAWGAPEREAAGEPLEAALEPGEGGVWLPLEALRTRGSSRRRALLAAWLVGEGEQGVSRTHIEHAAALAESGAIGRSLSLPGQRVLFRDRDALWLGPAPGPRFPGPFERWIAPPETFECPERQLGLAWCPPGFDPGEPDGWAIGQGSAVRVRSPLPGDRIALTDGRAPRLLRELFARSRWPRRRRARALVVEHEGRVVWVPGLARATPAPGLRHAWKLVIRPLSTPRDTC